MLENLPYFTQLNGYISGSVANLSLIKGSWRAKEGLHSWGARLVLKWRKESKKIEKNKSLLLESDGLFRPAGEECPSFFIFKQHLSVTQWISPRMS